MHRLIPLLALLAALPGAAAESVVPESELKTAFIYNFALFVEWPAGGPADSSAFRLCVLGKGPMVPALEALEGKPVRNRPIAVRHVAAPAADCHMLVVTGTSTDVLQSVLGSLKPAGILTVSDTEGAARNGAAIGLAVEQRRVVFEVNLAAAQRANLAISSKLMRLAKVVH